MKSITIIMLSIALGVIAKDNIGLNLNVGPSFIYENNYYYSIKYSSDTRSTFSNQFGLNIDGSIGYNFNSIKPEIGFAALSFHSHPLDFLYYLGLVKYLDAANSEQIGIRIGYNQFYENRDHFKDYVNNGAGIGFFGGIKIINNCGIVFNLNYLYGNVYYSSAPLPGDMYYPNYYVSSKFRYSIFTMSLAFVYEIKLKS